VNILEDGWICLEFTKNRKGEDKVTEVFRISPNGVKV
jgi:hypothetical protein